MSVFVHLTHELPLPSFVAARIKQSSNLAHGSSCKCNASIIQIQWTMQVFVSVPACIQLLEGPYLETNDAVVKAFRPAGLIRSSKPAAP